MSIVSRLINNPESYSIGMLQRGVQTGTIPPYIGIPLIQEKMQQKKEMQGAQGAGPMPTVAEQVMAQAQQETAPRMPQQMAMARPAPVARSMGIEGLKSNLPTEYASGGIVAFGEGGDVERYQVGGAMQSPISLEELVKLYRTDPALAEQTARKMNRLGALRQVVGAVGVPGAVLDAGTAATLYAGTKMAEMSPEQRQQFYANPVLAAMAGNTAEAGAIMNAPGMTPPSMSYGEQMKNVALSPFRAGASAVKTLIGAPGYGLSKAIEEYYTPKKEAEKEPEKAPEGAPAPAPAPAPTKSGIDQLLSGLGLGGTSASGRTPGVGLQPSSFAVPPKPYMQSQTDVLNRQLYGTETEPGFFARSTARQEEQEQKIKEAEGKITGKAYEGLEASLKKEAEEIGADKEQAKYMAMFKAGLAMMAGTSRHALENIGKGAMVGAEDYQKAASDIKKAQKENQKMMAQIEQARRAESIGDRDRAINRLDKYFEAQQRRDEFGVNAIMQATGKDRDVATEIWKTEYSGAKAIEAAHIAGGYQLAGQDISGKYSLAGHMLSAMGKDRLTPYQESRLRMEAQKQYSMDDARREFAAAQKLEPKSLPKPGADPKVDAAVDSLYRRRIDEMIYGAPMGAPAAANPSNIQALVNKYAGK